MKSQTLRKKMTQVLASALEKPILNIEQFELIADNDYGLIFSTTFDKDYTFEDYNKALNELTDNAFSIQAESLLPFDSRVNNSFKCIVRANVESIPYTEDNLKGFQVIRANIFTDEIDKIWKLEGDGDNKRLVRVSREDYDSILESKKHRSSVLSSEDANFHEIGDYAYFFNHNTKAMDFGFIVNSNKKDYILSRSSESLVEITTPLQIITAHMEKDINKRPLVHKQKMVLSAEYSFQGYLDYIKKLYGASNPYFLALEKAMKEYTVG